MKRFAVHLLSIPVLLGLCNSAKADTLTGVFSNPVYAGNVLNDPTVGTPAYVDNNGTAVTGMATAGGAACVPANTLCWGLSTSGVAAADSYSSLAFTGTAGFDPGSTATQSVGTIYFLNGTSDLDTLIFGATLSIYDNGDLVGAYNVAINTTSNQYGGTGLTSQELATDADYISICGNDSNICGSSIEAYEDSEGGTGLLVDLTGNLVGDPTLDLDTVAVDPSQSSCTTCGIVGDEPALAATPEPPGFLLLSTAALLFAGFSWRQRLRRVSVANS